MNNIFIITNFDVSIYIIFYKYLSLLSLTNVLINRRKKEDYQGQQKDEYQSNQLDKRYHKIKT